MRTSFEEGHGPSSTVPLMLASPLSTGSDELHLQRHLPPPRMTKKQGTARQNAATPSSMTFIAPVNEHWMRRGARGVNTKATSFSAEVGVLLACTLIGVGVAFIVTLLHECIHALSRARLWALDYTRGEFGALAAWALQVAISFGLAFVALLCVVAAPHARGSGLPQLLAYLNGVKLSKFTSFKVLSAKWVGTCLVVGGGFYVGPEGPIIHMGACVGKLLLRLLYHLGQLRPLGAFVHFKNDLDERDFVAIGAGAGVCAAFLAPISAVLFVVEEASSHFSKALLWRTLYVSIITLWSTHLMRQVIIFSSADDPEERAPSFYPEFPVASGTTCEPDVYVLWLLPLSFLNGLLGAAFNGLVLHLNRVRRQLYARLGAVHEAAAGLAPSRATRRFVVVGALEMLLIAALSVTTSVLLPLRGGCTPQVLGAMYYGAGSVFFNECPCVPTNASCAQVFERCGGASWDGPTCCVPGASCVAESAVLSAESAAYSQCMPSVSALGVGCAAKGEQCGGGIDWSGPTCCVQGGPYHLTCERQGTYFAQCVEEEAEKDEATFNEKPSTSIRNTCMAPDLREQIMWAAVNGSTAAELCDCCCLQSYMEVDGLSRYICDEFYKDANLTMYSELATLLLKRRGTVDATIKVLFLRGLPAMLGPASLLVGFVCWFFFAALTAGSPVPCGLLMPLIITGACSGRLYALLLMLASAPGVAEPGLFALFGATSLLAGSGQIRLFFTMVMLEITGQINVAPFVAVSAIVGNAAASFVTRHGLYHALIEAAGLPYLPLERPPEFDEDARDSAVVGDGAAAATTAPTLGTARVFGCGEHLQRWLYGHWLSLLRTSRVHMDVRQDAVLVRDVMTPMPLLTVRSDETRQAVLSRLGEPPAHHGFPVLGPTGALVGLLTLSELYRLPADLPDDEATVSHAMDQCPCLCQESWPCSRAHRLFATLGLRHLLVLGPNMELAGIITRHDLQQGVVQRRRRTNQFTSAISSIHLGAPTSSPA